MDELTEHFYKRNISSLDQKIFHKAQSLRLDKKRLKLLKKEYKSYLMEELYRLNN